MGDKQEFIEVIDAGTHNLKDISVKIPQGSFTVITGLSGSGKSSLAFNTLYAEGQRRYVECLSSYARQFLGKIEKPKVRAIKGLAPAIAIEQRVSTSNPRSTVGTATEIYDYIKLLFARTGEIFSPLSNRLVKKDTVSDGVDLVRKLAPNSKILIMSPIASNKLDWKDLLTINKEKGFARVWHKGSVMLIDQALELSLSAKDTLYLVIDRMITKDEPIFYERLADSLQTAFLEGDGQCIIEEISNGVQTHLSDRLSMDGIDFMEPSPLLFSFNNPYGACPECEGYGTVVGIDPNLVIPNVEKSIYDDAISCWRGEKMQAWKNNLIEQAHRFNFPVHTPYHELSLEEKELLWTGNKHFEGLNAFFKMLEENIYKIQYRVMLSRYRGKTVCPACRGNRLGEQAEYVMVSGKKITDLINIPLEDLKLFFDNEIRINTHQRKIAKQLLIEIKSRLNYLLDVGLGYLTLNRTSNTLSGGESQRIQLATSVGSSLVGALYILDEPSIGLHSRDTGRLINVLKKLQAQGNTVIIVEHDEDIIKSADYLIDIGPRAGSQGGEVVYQGSYVGIYQENSLTARYLKKDLSIKIPDKIRPSKFHIEIVGAKQNNLKNINVRFPLNNLVVVSGVSGCGKSTLIQKTLYPALRKEMGQPTESIGLYTQLKGDLDKIKDVVHIGQNPIGKSSRSSPVTYLKIFDDIRTLYAQQPLSKLRGYTSKYFSFNTPGGRCENCKGEGQITVEMQFMADVSITCETCQGKRFKTDVLEVLFQEKNIYDVLELTIEEAFAFFKENKQNKIAEKLTPLLQVGLGYLHLGQSSSTLSGGEAQRIKLASFLSKGNQQGNTLFIFDEPSTGLHFYDVSKLLDAFYALLDKGHSLIVVEHNLDVIKCADHLIDLGPLAGNKGGKIMAEGTPREVAQIKDSFTGLYLKEKF